MANPHWTTWQEALVTVAILWLLAFMIVGTIISIYLAKENNKWSLLLSFFALPLIGLIICLVIIEKKYQTFSNLIKKMKGS